MQDIPPEKLPKINERKDSENIFRRGLEIKYALEKYRDNIK